MEQTKDLARWSQNFGVELSSGQLDKFSLYINDLLAWNDKINLTSITDHKAIVIKHFIDSIACHKALLHPIQGQSLLDVGSGAGFPGLPLKIAYPELDVTLLEPSSKKTAFLRYLIGTLELTKVKVVPKNIEQISLEKEKFSHIITRALTMTSLFHYCLDVLTAGGRMLLCRSQPLPQETDLHGFKVDQEFFYELPEQYGRRVVTVLTPR